MMNLIKKVVAEFRDVRTANAAVHTSANLAVLLDTLLEQEKLVPPKNRRQGRRGARSARNHMLRKALWYARNRYLRPSLDRMY